MEMFDTLTMLAASDELTDEKRSQLHCFISDNWRKFKYIQLFLRVCFASDSFLLHVSACTKMEHFRYKF